MPPHRRPYKPAVMLKALLQPKLHMPPRKVRRLSPLTKDRGGPLTLLNASP